MRRVFLLLMLFAGILLYAQAPASWGTKAGMNLSQHYGTKGDEGDFEVKTGLRPGFVGGANLDFAASEILSLGFEALYSMKGSYQTITIRYLEIHGVVEELEKPAKMRVKYFLDYFELPVLLKLKIMDKPAWDMSVITGSAMSLKLKGYHDLDGTVFFPDGNGGFDPIRIRENSDLSSVNMFDYSLIYGGALRLKSRIPISLEYRFTLGWDYLSLPTYQLFDPVQLRNQTWSLMLSSTF
jgi:hypothetical protein